MRDRNAPLTPADIESLDWEKMGGLLPAAVQDGRTGRFLMLAYMSREALAATFDSGLATFHSRSKERLWQKGESSGHRLPVLAIHEDCDGDALLVLVEPLGPACHLGTPSCFGGDGAGGPGWLAELSRIVADRAESGRDGSYTASLLREGPQRIAQKVGEEGVEVALAAVARDTEGCVEEVADLVFHLTVLMRSRGFDWDAVVAELRRRHQP